jgi:hypothetical protein
LYSIGAAVTRGAMLVVAGISADRKQPIGSEREGPSVAARRATSLDVGIEPAVLVDYEDGGQGDLRPVAPTQPVARPNRFGMRRHTNLLSLATLRATQAASRSSSLHGDIVSELRQVW